MDVSNKILEKYEVLQHQYLKDTGCDSHRIPHAAGGFDGRRAYHRAHSAVRIEGFPGQGSLH